MEYYGHLALRIGFIKETGNSATIYITGTALHFNNLFISEFKD